MRNGLELILAGLIFVSPTLNLFSEPPPIKQTEQEKHERIYVQIRELETQAQKYPSSEIYEKISDLYGGLKEWRKSFDNAWISSKLGPNRWEPITTLSTAVRKLNDVRGALEFAKQAVSISENTETCYQLGCMYSHIHDNNNALIYLNRALELDPNNKLAIKSRLVVLSNMLSK